MRPMVRAVIFDMDGVISDTQSIYSQIDSDLLAAEGIDIDPADVTARFAGVKSALMFQTILWENGKGGDFNAMADEKRQRYKEILERGVRSIPGSLELIDSLKSSGFQIAVGSASQLPLIDFILDSLKIRSKFDAIASTEEVGKGKPAPDVFLLAAKRIGVSPEDCVVIEDGLAGMIGAKRAGMKCIALVPEGSNADYPVDIIVHSLKDLTIEKIKKL